MILVITNLRGAIAYTLPKERSPFTHGRFETIRASNFLIIV
ncbi:MAG TPA: hypothetical protein V6D14_23635 [Coleofasciculaceae cyanobacterium]